MPQKNKTQMGFTIVELLVVIIVIGILATIVVGSSNAYFHNAADSATKASLESAARRLDIYKLKNGLYDFDGALLGYSPAKNVIVTEKNTTTATTYCLEAQSDKYTDVTYYADNKGNVTETSC